MNEQLLPKSKDHRSDRHRLDINPTLPRRMELSERQSDDLCYVSGSMTNVFLFPSLQSHQKSTSARFHRVPMVPRVWMPSTPIRARVHLDGQGFSVILVMRQTWGLGLVRNSHCRRKLVKDFQNIDWWLYCQPIINQDWKILHVMFVIDSYNTNMNVFNPAYQEVLDIEKQYTDLKIPGKQWHIKIFYIIPSLKIW